MDKFFRPREENSKPKYSEVYKWTNNAKGVSYGSPNETGKTFGLCWNCKLKFNCEKPDICPICKVKIKI